MIQPYYQDDRVTLYHGDALDVLPTIAAGSVHLCVTDPPYVVGAVSAGNMASKSGGWADTAVDWPRDPNDAEVQTALQWTCDLCSAAKHELCTNPIKPGQPLPGGRLVHTARLTDRRREK